MIDVIDNHFNNLDILNAHFPKNNYEYVVFAIGNKDGVYEVSNLAWDEKPTVKRLIAKTWKKAFNLLLS